MSNIMDYLKWRGDISFTLLPLNEVDNLILATLSYIRMDGVVPLPGEGEVSIEEAASRFDEFQPEESGISFLNVALRLLKACAKTDRFREVRVKNYLNRYDADRDEQFCAMEFVLPDGTIYIAFRGTDDTIVGWKEDFYLSLGVVTAQTEAAGYARQIIETEKPAGRKIYIGGHSKGGNLAEYAAARLPEEYQSTILEVFNNDGPGFDPGFIQDKAYQLISPRIRLFVPSFGIVGELLEHGTVHSVVQSKAKTVMAHDPFTWQVMGTRFENAPALYKSAQVFNQSLASWINQLEADQKKAFISDFFAVLEAPGVRTLSDLASGGITVYTQMLRRLAKVEPENRKIIGHLMAAFLENLIEWGEDTLTKFFTGHEVDSPETGLP